MRPGRSRSSWPAFPILLELGSLQAFARPGANITGTSGMTGEVVGKTLELLKEVVPKLSRLAVLSNPDNAVFQAQMLKGTEAAAGTLGVQLQAILDAMGSTGRSLGVELQDAPVRGAGDLESALSEMALQRVDGVTMNEDPVLLSNSQIIATIMMKRQGVHNSIP